LFGELPLPLFSSMLNGPCPLCSVPFLISSLLFRFFSLSVGRESVCPGGYAGLSQGWLWEYRVPCLHSPVGPCLPSRFGAGSVW
jgi:hypothetical protein